MGFWDLLSQGRRHPRLCDKRDVVIIPISEFRSCPLLDIPRPPIFHAQRSATTHRVFMLVASYTWASCARSPCDHALSRLPGMSAKNVKRRAARHPGMLSASTTWRLKCSHRRVAARISA